MNCCGTKQVDEQPFPKMGILHQNLDLNLEQILIKLGETQSSDVYAYILSTVSSGFFHKGSAPNFQGDHITLCTCKHYMRSCRAVDEWKDVWIAGFTSYKWGHNYLFYLMRVEHAFRSFRELWEAKILSASSKQAKNVSKNSLGDLFRPISLKNGNDFSIVSYQKPMIGHSHRHNERHKEWEKDIKYENRQKLHAPLLVGNPKFSFLWTRPLIMSSHKLCRGHRHYKVRGEFSFSSTLKRPLTDTWQCESMPNLQEKSNKQAIPLK